MLKITSNKKFIIFIGASILIIIAIIFGFWKLYDWYLSTRPYTYEAAVQMRNQISPNPKEDARSSLKKGDAVVIYPKGYQWSETEKTSQLILKLNISEAEAKQLMAAEETNGDITKARAYRIKIEKLRFDPEKIWKKQPFERKVFDDTMIEKK